MKSTHFISAADLASLNYIAHAIPNGVLFVVGYCSNLDYYLHKSVSACEYCIKYVSQYAPLSLRPLTCEVFGGHRKIDRIFNHEKKVLQAGRVGGGYDRQLRDILHAEIMPLVEEFDEKLNPDSVYEERLQAAADHFITAASKLPRATGCYPPCGFQASGAVYNCVTCLYDSCEYPLDCPVVDLTVGESNSTEMQCDVQFPLPNDIEVVWRFAPEIKTQQVEQFGLVTVGQDQLYFISSARIHHQGTYQCEIFSQQRSIVRTYHYLQVIPQVLVAQAKLQGTFDMAVLSGAQIPSLPAGPSSDLTPTPASIRLLPSPLLMAACLTSLLLLLFLSLGFMFWWIKMTRDQGPRIIHLFI